MAARTLLVEGNDDQHVMWALFKHHNVRHTFEVEKTDGVDRLLESVPVRLKLGSEVERIAVVIDADEDVDRTWVSLRDRLRVAGYENIPESPSAEGTVVELHDGRHFAAWIMPDNRLPGILEHFVEFLVPEDDSMMEYVDRFLSQIPEDARRFPQNRIAKSRIHAWLSVQTEPGRPLGQAITMNYLDAEVEAAIKFVQWVNRALVD